jgi:hypothetical protein
MNEILIKIRMLRGGDSLPPHPDAQLGQQENDEQRE